MNLKTGHLKLGSQKGKKRKKNFKSEKLLRDLYINYRSPRKRRKKGLQTLFEETMFKNFSTPRKEMNIQI